MTNARANLIAFLLVGILISANLGGAEEQHWLTRSKRQAQNERPSGNNIAINQRPALRPSQLETAIPAGVSAAGAAIAGTLNSSPQLPNTGGIIEPPANQPSATSPSRPVRPKLRPRPVDLGPDDDQDDAELEVPPKRRRPVARPQMRPIRPSRPEEDVEEAEEDCDEYDEQDYGNVFDTAFRPMRQLGHMMFEHMHDLALGDHQDYPEAIFAAASSRSTDDGYSRQSSIIRNNGRTRGIISETRNGRTQTRRIGDDE